MKVNKVYWYIKDKYTPIIAFFISWPNDFESLFTNLINKTGVGRDYHIYEYEENHTVTFYDLSGKDEKSVNVTIKELLEILEPMYNDYLAENPYSNVDKNIEKLKSINNIK